MTNILVIDVGTTGLRAAVVDETLAVCTFEYRTCAPTNPAPGLVEFDAARMAELVLDAAHAVLDRARELLATRYLIDHGTFQIEPDDHTGCDDITW